MYPVDHVQLLRKYEQEVKKFTTTAITRKYPKRSLKSGCVREGSGGGEGRLYHSKQPPYALCLKKSMSKSAYHQGTTPNSTDGDLFKISNFTFFHHESLVTAVVK
ncbi:hypothetical protein RF11_11875 [Thelohanellus kitauei]|uniref:Uncharacterized protein n=1 Tax=Thelohanellus kitauei TaxID=669202 RepID=A0A0C2NED2_THEKT|nr:hypothetical protein RF11_11875 [Thelohanellus kitauei]